MSSLPGGAETSQQVEAMKLESLPIELLQLICEYVDARTLMQSLMCVNKQFYSIINDPYLWKRRILRKNKKCNVAFLMTELFDENTFNWKQCDWYLDVEYDYWSKYETNTTTTVFSGSHFSEVDAVLLTSDSSRGISASRDRSVCMWNLLSEFKQPIVHKLNSHTGWVWDLDLYNKHQFFSCSWDSTVKLWDIETFSSKSGTAQSFRNDAAVLSITSKQNFLAAGLYTPKILAHDPRVYGRLLFELTAHSRSIIDLCLVQDNFLVSLSEDRTLSVCDLRTQETIITINLTEHGSEGFPMSASYYENVLFVGDSKNDMYLFDCSKGLFNIIEIVAFEKPTNRNANYKLNSIKCTNYGSIICGGSAGVIHITTPTIPSKTIAKIDDANSEITSIDYQNDTLIAGYVNSDVQVWKKK